MSFLRRSWNAGNLIVVLGFIGLGFSFWLPQATARRTARVESWAENICALLLQAAASQTPAIDVASPEAAATIHAALDSESASDRLRPLSTEEATELPPGAYLEGKHYYYVVLRMASEEDGVLGPLEVCAWPRANLGPARTVFYFPQDAAAAYSHNLRARYSALERIPRAGAGRPPNDEHEEPGKYRTLDEERWVELPVNRRES